MPGFVSLPEVKLSSDMLSIRHLLDNLCLISLAVDPVVEGKTRSEQFYRGDSQGKKVLLMKPMN